MNQDETQGQEKARENKFKGNSKENSNANSWKLNISVYTATLDFILVSRLVKPNKTMCSNRNTTQFPKGL